MDEPSSPGPFFIAGQAASLFLVNASTRRLARLLPPVSVEGATASSRSSAISAAAVPSTSNAPLRQAQPQGRVMGGRFFKRQGLGVQQLEQFGPECHRGVSLLAGSGFHRHDHVRLHPDGF